MLEVPILIPLQDNQGETFTAAHHGQFETVILEAFGGFTLLPGTFTGAWMDDETTYSDELRAYLVALVSIRQGGQLGELVDMARAH